MERPAGRRNGSREGGRREREPSCISKEERGQILLQLLPRSASPDWAKTFKAELQMMTTTKQNTQRTRQLASISSTEAGCPIIS